MQPSLRVLNEDGQLLCSRCGMATKTGAHRATECVDALRSVIANLQIENLKLTRAVRPAPLGRPRSVVR